MKNIITAIIVFIVVFFLKDNLGYAYAGLMNIVLIITLIYFIVAILKYGKKPAVKHQQPEKFFHPEKKVIQKAPKKNNTLTISIVVILALLLFLKTLEKASASILIFLDNLVRFSNNISPIIAWAFLGLIVGAAYGSIVAWKKYKLDLSVNLLTIGAFILCMVLLFLINDPLSFH